MFDRIRDLAEQLSASPLVSDDLGDDMGQAAVAPSTVLTPVTRFERFWALADRRDPNGCWRWMGSLTDRKYGLFRINGKRHRAHRIAFELACGAAIPDGLVIDHLCRNPSCVNPAHLEVVTQQINTLRGDTIIAKQVARTHCVHGHEFTADNLIPRPGNPRRRDCRACARARVLRKREEQSALSAAHDD